MTIRAVIFDVGGVLIRTVDWSGRTKWETMLGLPSRALSTIVFDCDAARRASLGQASVSDIWDSVAGRLQLSREQLRELQVDFWAGDQVNADLVRYMETLRNLYKLAILSNAWPGWREMHASAYDLARYMDIAIYSYEEHVTKPDAAIFHIACNRLGVQSSDALFVDDFVENVDGAHRAGLRAVLYRSNTQVIDDITMLLQDGEYS